MAEHKKAPISLSQISKLAGLSKATVSYVLHNKRGPSSATRTRVLKIVKRLGYQPDARVISVMSTVRKATAKELVPIAWVDTNWDKDAWERYRFLSPYLEGAGDRCSELGYRLEKIWAAEPGMTMRRVSQIIYQRGIEGVIVTPGWSHINLNWDKLASVSFGHGLLAPRLHKVTIDSTFNLLLALKMLRRYGYRRIGICLDQLVGRSSYNLSKAAAAYFHASISPAEVIRPLYYAINKNENWIEIENAIATWIRENRPDVIVGHDNRLLKVVETLGFRVPEEIGVVHLATDDDVADWAGIHSRKREIGACAVETVVYALQTRGFGVPEAALNMSIRGMWHGGRTLIVPKPKAR